MIQWQKLFRAAMVRSFADSADRPVPLAAGSRNQVKITAVKAMQVGARSLIKVETDAGIAGYGPCGGSGPFARAAIAELEGGRRAIRMAGAPLGLIGKNPLAIRVHFHNMFYAYPHRRRQVRVLSGIDIALWDLAGKILGQPVSKLLGGNFRHEILLYSHCLGGDYVDKAAWRDRAQELMEDPKGFKAFEVDIHHPLGVRMQETIPSIGPREARKVYQAYTLAREAFGSDVVLSADIDIIVHCHAELDLPSAIKVAKAVEHIEPLFHEDPLSPDFSDSWLALRRTTRIPIMTGENIELAENAIGRSAVRALSPAPGGGLPSARPDQHQRRRDHRGQDHRRPGRPVPHPGVTAQCQWLCPEHGLAAVVGRRLQRRMGIRAR